MTAAGKNTLWRAFIAIWLLLAASVTALSATTNPGFDHVTTGFELEGKHQVAACESCHVNAVFKGTPRECSACHAKGTRVNAAPKPSGHILSTERCQSCHNASTFAPAVNFEHAEALGSCATCHNNVQAVGKPAGHIPTTAGCETCHKTTAWQPATFDHAGITGGCSSCHNGTRATGKNATHINSSNSCESCHSVNAWRPYTRVDHAQVIGTASFMISDGWKRTMPRSSQRCAPLPM